MTDRPAPSPTTRVRVVLDDGLTIPPPPSHWPELAEWAQPVPDTHTQEPTP